MIFGSFLNIRENTEGSRFRPILYSANDMCCKHVTKLTSFYAGFHISRVTGECISSSLPSPWLSFPPLNLPILYSLLDPAMG